jgi:hypothetical protein
VDGRLREHAVEHTRTIIRESCERKHEKIREWFSASIAQQRSLLSREGEGLDRTALSIEEKAGGQHNEAIVESSRPTFPQIAIEISEQLIVNH